MADLLNRQEQLYRLLCEVSGCRPMLRLCRDDDSLWICDLPRRLSEKQVVQTATFLAEKGYAVQLDDRNRLWKIDLPVTDPLYASCSDAGLLPQKETLHPAYALLRLLAAHPSPVETQPRELLRAVLKLTAKPVGDNRQAVENLHQQCAALLNRRLPLPVAASAALAQSIRKEEQQ